MQDRVERNIAKSGSCWEWQLRKDKLGYGRIAFMGKTLQAHRYSYMAFVGPIPDGLQIDHLCANRCCVNPDHLEVVTHAENVRRAYARKPRLYTHCRRGHELNEANAYRNGASKRSCRICRKLREQS